MKRTVWTLLSGVWAILVPRATADTDSDLGPDGRGDGNPVRPMLDSASAPVAEAIPDAWFYLARTGIPRGPVSLGTVRALIARGELDPDVLVARRGSDQWRPAAAIPEGG